MIDSFSKKRDIEKIFQEPFKAYESVEQINADPEYTAHNCIWNKNALKPAGVKTPDIIILAKRIVEPHAGQEGENIHTTAGKNIAVLSY